MTEMSGGGGKERGSSLLISSHHDGEKKKGRRRVKSDRLSVSGHESDGGQTVSSEAALKGGGERRLSSLFERRGRGGRKTSEKRE